MGHVRVIVDATAEAADIPEMESMPDDGYSNYLQDLMWVDHHDVLRALHGEYPLATTPRQVELLIDYLRAVKAQMQAAGK